MNERIKELLAKAYDKAVPETWTTLSSGQLERVYEKFAQLIVRECAQTLVDNTPVLDEYESQEDWDRGYGQAMRDCVHHIKEHFGVRE